MTRKDLVVKIANDTGMRQLDVKIVIDRTLEEIAQSLLKGEKVELRNFGVFKVRLRKGRKGRNPRTGNEVSIPAKRVAYFKVGRTLKARLR